MKKATLYFLLLISICSFGQIPKDSLQSKIINADKIEIVSHEDLYVIARREPGKYSSDYWRNIVENGKPNNPIIKERVTLDPKAIKELLPVLNQKTKIPDAGYHSCFDPHHTVLIYKNGNCSYLDICFGCLHYAVSEDIIVGENFMAAQEDWDNLELFFKKRNIKYKMPKEE